MPAPRPNIVIAVGDDLGFSDLGCFGGEILTPHLDRLADAGVRMSNFHNTPRCSPSRASLLTGLHPHQTGIGILTNNDTPEGYRGDLNDRCITIAEILKVAGYDTAIRGKWHLATDMENPSPAWPTFRGFDSFWGTLAGCGSYYQPGTLTRGVEDASEEAMDRGFFYTDRIADEAVAFLSERAERGESVPYFLYLAFTAPHWPLHARPETIAHYNGVYTKGWDAIRASRIRRQIELGLLPEKSSLSTRDGSVAPWEDEPEKAWQARRMQVYAAQVEEMDAAIGRVINAIELRGDLDDTLFIFLSDNGASDESVPLVELERFRQRTDIVKTSTKDGRVVHIGNDPLVDPGPEDTYCSYGRAWANVSNTPFRLYKLWAHEGGISAPFIVHWPNGGLANGTIIEAPYQLVNVMPTVLEATGTTYPSARQGVPLPPLPGDSMIDLWRGGAPKLQRLWWEHVGNGAIHDGRWKLVRQYGWPWELYEIGDDRVESMNLADRYPEVVAELVEEWERRCDLYGVIPFERTLKRYHERGLAWKDAIG